MRDPDPNLQTNPLFPGQVSLSSQNKSFFLLRVAFFRCYYLIIRYISKIKHDLTMLHCSIGPWGSSSITFSFVFVIKGVPVFLIGQYKKQQQISALCYTYYYAGFRFPIFGLSALIFPLILIGIFLYCKKYFLNKWLDKVNWVVTISSTVKRKCSFTYLQHSNRNKYRGSIHSTMYEYGWRSYISVVYGNRSDGILKGKNEHVYRINYGVEE